MSIVKLHVPEIMYLFSRVDRWITKHEIRAEWEEEEALKSSNCYSDIERYEVVAELRNTAIGALLDLRHYIHNDPDNVPVDSFIESLDLYYETLSRIRNAYL